MCLSGIGYHGINTLFPFHIPDNLITVSKINIALYDDLNCVLVVNYE